MFSVAASLSKRSASSALVSTTCAARLFSTSPFLYAAAQRAPRTRKQNIIKAVKAATPAPNSSAAVPHEDAFTVPRGSAKDAFNALFAQKKAATSTLTAEEEEDKEAVDIPDDAPRKDFDELQSAEEERQASHGEEELVEMREGMSAFADDMDDVEEATPVPPQQTSKKAHKTALPKDKDGDEDNDADEDEATPAPTATPNSNPNAADRSVTELMDNHGQPYVGEVAETIRNFAADKNFKSNIWGSRVSFGESQVTVNVTDEEGVSIHVGHRSLILFNLDQTDYKASVHAPSVLTDLLFRSRKQNNGNFRLKAPLDLRGLVITRKDRTAIMGSPLFGELHAKAALWVSLLELQYLGAEVRPEEKQRFCFCESSNPFPRLHAGGKEWVQEHFPDLDLTLLETGKLWFNISQLADEQRFQPYYENRDFFTPWSWSGRRYSPSYSFLLREYCIRYGFPVKDKHVVFAPVSRILSQGGSVLETPRETPMGSEVPPPFTLIMSDDSIMSMYNALQTDIAELLIDNAKKKNNLELEKRAAARKYVSDFSATVNEEKGTWDE